LFVVVGDEISQRYWVGRFRDVVREARAARLLTIGRLTISGHCNENRRSKVRHLAQCPRDFVPVHTRKTQVTHNHFRLVFESCIDASTPIMSLDDVMPDLVKERDEHFGNINVIVDD